MRKNGEGAPVGDEKGNSIQTVKKRWETNNTASLIKLQRILFYVCLKL